MADYFAQPFQVLSRRLTVKLAVRLVAVQPYRSKIRLKGYNYQQKTFFCFLEFLPRFFLAYVVTSKKLQGKIKPYNNLKLAFGSHAIQDETHLILHKADYSINQEIAPTEGIIISILIYWLEQLNSADSRIGVKYWRYKEFWDGQGNYYGRHSVLIQINSSSLNSQYQDLLSANNTLLDLSLPILGLFPDLF